MARPDVRRQSHNSLKIGSYLDCKLLRPRVPIRNTIKVS